MLWSFLAPRRRLMRWSFSRQPLPVSASLRAPSEGESQVGNATLSSDEVEGATALA
jgi:hypothetical protein